MTTAPKHNRPLTPLEHVAAAKIELDNTEDRIRQVIEGELGDARTLVYATKEAIRVARMLVGESEQRLRGPAAREVAGG